MLIIFKTLVVLWLVAMLIAGAWFASENSQLIDPRLFGFSLPQASSGFYLASIFALGVLVGFLISFLLGQWRWFNKNRQLSQSRKEVSRLKAQLPTDSR